MLKDIVRGGYETTEWYSLEFDDGHNNGFTFPCDEKGRVDPEMNPAAKENYSWCLKHPEKFARFSRITKHTQSWKEPDRGRCYCGNEVVLINEYYGACQCSKCGQWYNLTGMELLPPDEWGWDGTPLDEE